MTRVFQRWVTCAKCGARVSADTPFGDWCRRTLLDSREGLSIIDNDYVAHRFMTHGSRTVQFVLSAEVKTHSADVSASHYDTLAAHHRMLVNRPARLRDVNSGRTVSGGDVLVRRVRSLVTGQLVILNFFGYNLLQMSGETPDDSEIIRWNRRLITRDKLIGVLNMDLHPWSLQPLSARRHKAKKQLPLLRPA